MKVASPLCWSFEELPHIPHFWWSFPHVEKKILNDLTVGQFLPRISSETTAGWLCRRRRHGCQACGDFGIWLHVILGIDQISSWRSPGSFGLAAPLLRSRMKNCNLAQPMVRPMQNQKVEDKIRSQVMEKHITNSCCCVRVACQGLV